MKQANAAGKAYQTLFKQTWRTQETRAIVSHDPISVKGFKGDYTINIKQNGHVIESENFTLTSSGTSLEIHLPQHGKSMKELKIAITEQLNSILFANRIIHK